jgi:hypothetical protein
MRFQRLNWFNVPVLGALLLALYARAHAADETVDLPPVLPPPSFLANRDPLPDQLLKDKRTNSYLTGFPAFSANEETGLTIGAAAQWFDNGPDDSPFFRYTPYRRQIAVTATGSTGGSARALIGYDQPYVQDSPWRIRAVALYDRNKFENYFGVGESTLHALTYPGSNREFHDFEQYTEPSNKALAERRGPDSTITVGRKRAACSHWNEITGAVGCDRNWDCRSRMCRSRITLATLSMAQPCSRRGCSWIRKRAK